MFYLNIHNVTAAKRTQVCCVTNKNIDTQPRIESYLESVTETRFNLLTFPLRLVLSYLFFSIPERPILIK